MAAVVAGVAGAVIGFYLGGPTGAMLGWSIGSAVGSMLFQPTQQGPKLDDLKLQSSAYGVPIPITWGTGRIAGFDFWQTDLVPHTSKSGGKGGGGGQTTTSYTASFAIGFCVGSVYDQAGNLVRPQLTDITRLWADKRIIWEKGQASTSALTLTIYLGSETQMPDPTMQAKDGAGNVPGYRGTAYAMFTDIDMSPFFNRLPNIEAEVVYINTGTPFGLRRYSGFALDPGAFAGSIVAYSYPYLLNGQTLPDGKTLVSQNWRAARDYGPDLADGAFSYAETRRTLKGAILSVVGTAHNPFPQYPEQTQPMGYPQIFGFQIHGSMNNTLSYMNGNVLRIWPDGTNTPHYHLVSGWFTHGDAVNVPNEALIANRYPDGDGFSMWINGSIWVTAEAVYATGGGLGGNGIDGPEGTAFIRKYPITKGKPSLTPAASFTFPGYGGIHTPNPGFGYDVTVADDGFVYVLGSVNGVNEKQLFKFDKDLNLVRLWNSPDSAYYPTIPVLHLNFSPTSGGGPDVGYNSFTVYRDYIVVGGTVGTTVSAICFKLNADDTTTYVNSVPAFDPAYPTSITGPKIYLGKGFIAVRDGILTFNGSDGKMPWAQVVNEISAMCGMAAKEYDTSLVPYDVRFYVMTNQSAARQAVEQLMAGFFVDAVQTDTSIRYVPRGASNEATISDADLGAHPTGSALVPLFERTRVQEVDLPRRVNVTYYNVDADYQQNTQSAHRQTTSSQLESSLNLPIGFTDDEAMAVAQTTLFNAWIERSRAKISAPMKLVKWEPTSVLGFSIGSYRIINKSISVGGIVKFEMVANAESVYTQGAPSGPATGQPPPTPVNPQATQLFPLDIPLPVDISAAYGYPVLMFGAQRAAWVGAELFKSVDGGASYQTTNVIGTNADITGIATTVLGNFFGGNIFDEGNFVTIELDTNEQELTSATEKAVRGGECEYLLGKEIFHACTATLTGVTATGGNIYVLSSLLRGRRGTEWAMGTHAVNEQFCVLPSQTSYPSALSEIGQSVMLKAVTLGQSLADAVGVSFSNTGVAVRCYAPCQLGGGYNGAGDVTGTFVRRDRKGGNWLDFVEIPMSEPTEAYIVQIWDSTYTLCARIITVTVVAGATQSFTYTAAQQTADFGATQHDVFWSVGQLGTVALGSQAYGSTPALGASNGNPTTPIAPFAFPVAIAPIPGPTRTPDWTFTTVSGETIHPVLTVGQKWSGKFTTPAGTPRGSVSIAEYSGLPTFRHCWISSDSGGLNKMAHSEQYGQQLSALVGAVNGGAPLAASTDYYFFTDFVMADGSIIEVLGSSAPSIITIQIV